MQNSIRFVGTPLFLPLGWKPQDVDQQMGNQWDQVDTGHAARSNMKYFNYKLPKETWNKSKVHSKSTKHNYAHILIPSLEWKKQFHKLYKHKRIDLNTIYASKLSVGFKTQQLLSEILRLDL